MKIQLVRKQGILVAPPNDMEHQLAHLIASVNRQIEEDLEGRLRPEGLPIEQFRVLNALSQREGQPMGALAAEVLVDATTLTKLIDRMVAEALVYRAPDAHDRRKVLIFLAAKGRVLCDRVAPVVGERQRRIFAELQGDKAEELKRLLLSLKASAASNRSS
jgi:DNA-binding MarR family transcriptional regulator